MEGRAIARPNSAAQTGGRPKTSLQWRAEQLLGQTIALVPSCAAAIKASMEGRAIARPNSGTPTAIGSGTISFNGGPSNCSAKRATNCRRRSPRSRFNGGPSNCSAKPRPGGAAPTGSAELQWRAEQLLGQTGPTGWGATEADAVLQWRAEQLLGQTGKAICLFRGCLRSFNGGPSNCSAKPGSGPRWRPGSCTGFNGGPSNCSAKPDPVRHGLQRRRAASMEGRAIARPNTRPKSGRQPTTSLQWRAEQLLGQTGCRWTLRRRCPTRFNGGPSNCSAKRGVVGRFEGVVPLASMEGRAIARPNTGDPVP